MMRALRALDLAGAFWFLERPLFREFFKAFGLEDLWGFCENGDGSAGLSASLQSRLLPHPKGSEAHLRDIQPSGLNVLGKIGMWLRRWDSRRNFG